jgi:hypothetical protein
MMKSGINKFGGIFRVLVTLVLLGSVYACNPGFQNGEKSLPAIQTKVVNAILTRNIDYLIKILISEKEYIQYVHKFLPEGQGKSPIRAKDAFRTFIVQERDNCIRIALRRYSNKGIRVEKIDPPQKMEKYGPITLYFFSPVTLLKKDGKEKLDKDLLGLIIERDGQFKLMNVFRK